MRILTNKTPESFDSSGEMNEVWLERIVEMGCPEDLDHMLSSLREVEHPATGRSGYNMNLGH